MAQNIPIVNSQGAVPQTANPLEKTRAELHQYSQGMMVAAAILLISFWASYIFPFTLMVGAVVTGLLQYTHTKDYDTMLTDSTVAGPSQVFRYLTLMNGIGVIVGIVSQILCVVSLIVNATGGDFSTVDFIFQGISFGACATITVLAFMSYGKNKIVDTAVVTILAGAPAAQVAMSAASGAMANAPLMGNGHASYGYGSQQPAQQQYGQPNPYGQPQQGGYGATNQPATGTPVFSEQPRDDSKPSAPLPQ